MALISERDQQTLRELFDQRLHDDVTITYYGPRQSPLIVPGQPEPAHSHSGAASRQLLEELAALSDRIKVQSNDFAPGPGGAAESGVPRAPAFILEGKAQGRVRFFGLPSGYEFSTFVDDLLTVSSGETALSDETRDALAGLDQDVHIQVFGTPT